MKTLIEHFECISEDIKIYLDVELNKIIYDSTDGYDVVLFNSFVKSFKSFCLQKIEKVFLEIKKDNKLNPTVLKLRSKDTLTLVLRDNGRSLSENKSKKIFNLSFYIIENKKIKIDLVEIWYSNFEEKIDEKILKILVNLFQLTILINDVARTIILNSDSETNDKEIDLSDTIGIDKILYLQKLGVIDFLRVQQPFSTSVNSLASVLSAITGEKAGTLQPMLNPMLSKKVDDKNNPLNSKKAVGRVEKQLINIGFNLNETN